MDADNERRALAVGDKLCDAYQPAVLDACVAGAFSELMAKRSNRLEKFCRDFDRVTLNIGRDTCVAAGAYVDRKGCDSHWFAEGDFCWKTFGKRKDSPDAGASPHAKANLGRAPGEPPAVLFRSQSWCDQLSTIAEGFCQRDAGALVANLVQTTPLDKKLVPLDPKARWLWEQAVPACGSLNMSEFGQACRNGAFAGLSAAFSADDFCALFPAVYEKSLVDLCRRLNPPTLQPYCEDLRIGLRVTRGTCVTRF